MKPTAKTKKANINYYLDEIDVCMDKLEVKKITKDKRVAFEGRIRKLKIELKALGYKGKMRRLKKCA